MPSSARVHALLLLVVLVGCRRPAGAPDAGQGRERLTVAAALSLRHVMPDLADAFAAGNPAVDVSLLYGTSVDLLPQLEKGAPIDAVVFAAIGATAPLVQEGRVRQGRCRVVATDRLALVGPRGGVRLSFVSLDELRPGERLALGDPERVSSGAHAREGLRALGLWDGLRGHLVLERDAVAVLDTVRREEAVAGIVYRTDLEGAPDVVFLDEAKGSWAPQSEFSAGWLHEGRAADFVRFLCTPEAQAIWRRHGFGLP